MLILFIFESILNNLEISNMSNLQKVLTYYYIKKRILNISLTNVESIKLTIFILNYLKLIYKGSFTFFHYL